MGVAPDGLTRTFSVFEAVCEPLQKGPAKT